MCQIENTKLKNIMAIIGLNMSLKVLRITGFLKTGSISQPGVPTISNGGEIKVIMTC